MARLSTIVLLASGGLAGLLLVAWSIYARQGDIMQVRGPGIVSGLRLAAKLNVAYLAVIGAGSIAALALAYLIVLRKRWAYVAAVLASGVGIALARYALTIVTKLEDPRYVKKSAWVQAASSVTMAVTIFLALAIVAAAVAWLSDRKQPRT